MLNFNKMYLVRHGSYNRSPQELTSRGREESEGAGWQLKSAGVIRNAVLLSSDALRALQTTAIIASIVEATVFPSSRMNIIGNYTEGVESLDDMVEAALVEAGTAPEGENLIVVTHQPLIEIAAFGASIANGQVVEYQPQTWQNHKFNEREQQILIQQLGSAGLG